MYAGILMPTTSVVCGVGSAFSPTLASTQEPILLRTGWAPAVDRGADFGGAKAICAVCHF